MKRKILTFILLTFLNLSPTIAQTCTSISSPCSNPGSLTSYRGQNGAVLYFTVTGSTSTSGGWGTDIYTDDTALALAAVHVGALAAGQTGVVEVTIVAGQSTYTGSTRNGVTTSGYGSWVGSYSVAGCPSGKYRDSSNNCINCPTGCATCSSSSNCQTCQAHYGLSGTLCQSCGSSQYTSSSSTCQNCPTGCSTCTSSTSCQTCFATYGLSGGVCQACSAAYYTNSASNCQACPTGCASCTSNSNCQTCVATYGLAGTMCYSCDSTQYTDASSNCQSCPTGCASCTSNSNCQTCSATYGLTGTMCQSCGAAKYTGSASTCQNCPTGCASCTSSSNCQTCSATYGLTGTMCQPCGVAKYTDSASVCQSCPTGCTSCTSSTDCQTCMTTYGLTGTMCYSCSTTQYTDSASICQSCPTGCASCTSNSNCQTCSATYGLTGTMCQSCGAAKYTDSASVCQSCPTGCASCTSSSDCQTCLTTYGLTGTMCISCSNTQYTNSASTCQDCPTGCTSCTSNSNCQTCSATYGLTGTMCQLCGAAKYTDSTSVCQSCPTGCASCTSNTDCQTCLATYGLRGTMCQSCNATEYTDSNSLCQPCPPGCSSCTSNTVCQTCFATYGLKGTMCESCAAAEYTDSSSLCQACPTGCANCTSSTACQTCLVTYGLRGTMCESCGPARYTDSASICQNCPTGCANCTNNTMCQSCVSGYGPVNTTCAACPLDCDTCINDAQLCISCKTSTFLYQNNCINACPMKTFQLTQPLGLGGFCFDNPSNCAVGNYSNYTCDLGCTVSSTCLTCDAEYDLVGSSCVPAETAEAAAAKAANQVYSAVVTSSLCLGNSAVLNLGMISELIQNIRLINVKYPKTLQILTKSWSEDPIPIKLPSKIVSSLNSKPVSAILDAGGVDPTFIMNTWSSVLLIIGFTVLYGTLLFFKTRFDQKNFFKKAEPFSFNLVIGQIFSTVSDTVFYFIIELQTIEFHSAMSVLSLLLALVMLILSSILIVLHAKHIFNRGPAKLAFLHDELKDTAFHQRGFLIMMLLRDIVVRIIIISIPQYPLFQIVLALLISATAFWYVIEYNPFKRRFSQIIHCSLEVIVLVVYSSVLAIANGADHQEELAMITKVANYLLLFIGIFQIFATLCMDLREYIHHKRQMNHNQSTTPSQQKIVSKFLKTRHSFRKGLKVKPISSPTLLTHNIQSSSLGTQDSLKKWDSSINSASPAIQIDLSKNIEASNLDVENISPIAADPFILKSSDRIELASQQYASPIANNEGVQFLDIPKRNSRINRLRKRSTLDPQRAQVEAEKLPGVLDISQLSN